jgi:hypothetical protein
MKDSFLILRGIRMRERMIFMDRKIYGEPTFRRQNLSLFIPEGPTASKTVELFMAENCWGNFFVQDILFQQLKSFFFLEQKQLKR